MSSVDRSGRASQTDQLRNQREEFQEREAELVKRQKAEARRQSQNQTKEIERIKNNYETYIRELKDNSGNALSDQDRQHQEEISKVRNLYNEQLRKKVEDAEDRMKLQSDTTESQRVKAEAIDQQQRQLLAEQFRASIADREATYSSLTEKNRVEMQDAIKKRTEQLNSKHKNEASALTDERDQVVTDAAVSVTKARNDYDNLVRESRRKSSDDLDRAEDRYMDNNREQSRTTSEALKLRDVELQEARKNFQGKFAKLVESKNEEMDNARENLVEKTNERMDNQVRSLVLEAQNQKNSRFHDLNYGNRIHDLEKKNLAAAYEDRLAKVVNEKNLTTEIHKDLADRRISKAVRGNDNLLGNLNRQNQTEKLITSERYKDDRARLEAAHRQEQEVTKTKTDTRVDKVLKASYDSQDIQAKNFQDNLAQVKNNYSENLMTQRQAQLGQMKDTYLRMEQRLMDTEKKQAEKVEKLTDMYENKLKQVESKYATEMRKREQALVKQMGGQKMSHRDEVKTQETKFDIKLTQLEDAHQREIDRLEKRHQEQMAGLADRLNYYRRKA